MAINVFEKKSKLIVINLCLAVAIFFNIQYLGTTHFSFMVSLFHHRMLNIPSLSYTFMRFLYVLLPILMLTPSEKMEKADKLKYNFYAMGVLYLLGNTWVIYFLFEQPIENLFDLNRLSVYLQAEALNFDYLVWDSYDLFGVLFSTITAGLYFSAGYYIDKKIKLTVKLYWINLVCSFLLPLIYVLIFSDTGALSTMWLQKNINVIVSGIFMGIALTVSASSYNIWQVVMKGEDL